MSAALLALPGTRAVRVNLPERIVVLELARGNTLTLDRIRQAIRSKGFSPAAAHVWALGRIVDRDGRPALAITGSSASYVLVDDPGAPGTVATLRRDSSARLVRVRGRLAEPAVQLEVRSYSLE